MLIKSAKCSFRTSDHDSRTTWRGTHSRHTGPQSGHALVTQRGLDQSMCSEYCWRNIHIGKLFFDLLSNAMRLLTVLQNAGVVQTVTADQARTSKLHFMKSHVEFEVVFR